MGFTFICNVEEAIVTCVNDEPETVKPTLVIEENKQITQADKSTVEDDPLQRRILMVEDDPLQRRISLKKLTRYTKNQNIHVDIACDGAEGLRMMRDRMYDAVVTDMNMPIMDGITMINNGKREGVLPTIYKLLSAQTFDVATLTRRRGADPGTLRGESCREASPSSASS